MIRFSNTLPGFDDCVLTIVAGSRSEPFAQVDGAVVAERQNRLAGLRVDRLQIAVHLKEQPAVRAVLALPVVDAARRDALQPFVNPDFASGRGVERDERIVSREHVDDVVDDERAEDVRDVVAAWDRSRRPSS